MTIETYDELLFQKVATQRQITKLKRTATPHEQFTQTGAGRRLATLNRQLQYIELEMSRIKSLQESST